VTIYKTVLLLQRKLAGGGGKERSGDTFWAGLVGGWYVFGERNAVNEQVSCQLRQTIELLQLISTTYPDCPLRSWPGSQLFPSTRISPTERLQDLLHTSKTRRSEAHSSRIPLSQDTTAGRLCIQAVCSVGLGKRHVAVQE
jgi:hypothetical protein